MDLVAAGYPCQPFSLAGKRGGEADERHLWPVIRDIVAELLPWICIFENVSGHVSLGLDAVLRDLENLGYRSAGILLRASDVGAPHRRERLFVMAAYVADGLHERLGVFCQSFDDDGPLELEAGHDVDGCDPAVVDAGRIRLGATRRAAEDSNGGRNPTSRFGREEVAYAGGERGSEPDEQDDPERAARRASLGARTPVAFPHGVDANAGGHDAEPVREHGSSATDLRGSGGDVPYADRRAIYVEPERGEQFATFREHAEPLRAGFPGFPPLPDDLDGWSRYLERRPDLEPSVRRGTHGVRSGVVRDHVDRLRALGNSVVQQQAEVAIRLLARGLYDALYGADDVSE